MSWINISQCKSVWAVTSSKQVEVWVSTQHPEAIMVPPKGLHPSSFGHVPNPNALVLRVGQDELLPWVEDCTGHIVVVATACVQLPSLGFCQVKTTMTFIVSYSMYYLYFREAEKQQGHWSDNHSQKVGSSWWHELRPYHSSSRSWPACHQLQTRWEACWGGRQPSWPRGHDPRQKNKPLTQWRLAVGAALLHTKGHKSFAHYRNRQN